VKVTYAQAAASHTLPSKIFTQTDSVPSIPDSDGSKFRPYQTRMQPKPADPPKQTHLEDQCLDFITVSFICGSTMDPLSTPLHPRQFYLLLILSTLLQFISVHRLLE
jgi:hypothetical protein